MASLPIGLEPVAVPDIAEALTNATHEGHYDYIVAPLVHPRYRRQFAGSRAYTAAPDAAAEPFTRSDTLLSSSQWNTFIVGSTSPWINPDHPRPLHARNSCLAFQEELRWACHLSLPAVIVQPPRPPAANYARILNQTANKLSYGQLWVRLPLVDAASDPWEWWNALRTMCEYQSHIHPVLQFTSDLPSEADLARWLAEPLKAVIIPTHVFLTNRAGFPALSRRHQQFLNKLFLLKIQVIISGAPRHANGHYAYSDYIRHLHSQLPRLTEKEEFESPYYDYLQAPLQPLMDNLESQTYETFERDPVKYALYEEAILKALQDRAGAPTVLMVVGAGRGPLVKASLRAGKEAGYDATNLTIYAVEKNPNAIVTLLNLKRDEWGSQVMVVDHDMRTWQAPQKADILVSELLGSFGDNELSPECLDGAQRFLNDDGISIPSSYTSFVAPLCAHKIWADVKQFGDLKHFETAFVVRVFNCMELSDPLPVFTFVHPNRDQVIDNNRYLQLHFTAKMTGTVHGFVGYFDATLYKDVHCSILPATFSDGMFSWFPIFFPLRTPVRVQQGQRIEASFWRNCASAKVWYEWCLTAPSTSPIHNPNGRSYWIGL